MEKLIRTGLQAALTAVLIPVLVLTAVGAMRGGEPTEQTAEQEHTEAVAVETAAESVSQPERQLVWDAQQTVQLQTADGMRQLPLDEYLVGVLAGELPRSFESAAIAAQAVAARTFTLRQMSGGKHGVWLCSDASCCQAWTEEIDEDWRMELEAAVAQTDGQVLSYEGQLIEALFFSCSGGRTEAAVAVWGGEVPYLIPVDSPGEEAAPRYSGTVRCTAAEFRETILKARPEAFLSGPPEGWLGQTVYTEGGGVASLEVGDATIPGTELRSLFGLNSTCFTLRLEEGMFIFETLGFGHRVGMSQYGANAMAQAGESWQTILAHYYPGTELTCLLQQ